MLNVDVLGRRMCIFVHLANVVHRVSFIQFSEMPRLKWTKQSSERYWQQRPSRVILRSTNVRQLNETRAGRRSERLRKRATRNPQQRAIYSRYLSLVQTCRRMIYGTWSPGGSCSTYELVEANSTDYAKYQLLLGCPGTGKTQVVKRLIHTLIEEEYSVTVCAPLGLLATNYREEFYPDLQADTIHALFNIPIAADQQYVVNYNIGKYDAIIIDEASMVADDTFDMIHDTLEKQVHRPLVIIAGDECQQPPLQTINGRTTQTTSILKNRRLREVCQIHSLYQQFRCTDKAYMDFLQYIRHSRPQQYVVDNFQRPLLLFNQSDITDFDIWHTLEDAPDATFLSLPRC